MIFTPDEASKYLQAIVIHERINSGTNIQDFAMACYRLKSRAETAERELAELREYARKFHRMMTIIGDWLGDNRDWNLNTEPPWFAEFCRLRLVGSEIPTLPQETE